MERVGRATWTAKPRRVAASESGNERVQSLIFFCTAVPVNRQRCFASLNMTGPSMTLDEASRIDLGLPRILHERFGSRHGLQWDPRQDCCLRLLQTATVTRKKVAGMEVASLLGLLFWLANNSSSSLCRSAARPFFSAASNAFMVGP